jgi:hypothetical protein
MKHTILLATVLVSFLGATAANAAQYIVAEARGIAMTVGSVIDPTKPLVLKQGQHLTLISDSGQTIKLDGPYQKAPIAAQGVQLAAAFGSLVTNQNGRTGEIGTTRGTSAAHLPEPWLIDATRPGNVCLKEGAAPVLWRPAAEAQADVVVSASDRSWKAEANWPKGDDKLVVKSDMGMHGNASYFVSVNGSEQAITINTVPATLANDQMRAAWMIQKGCSQQAEALMRSASK